MVERKYVITAYDAPVIFDKSIQHSEISVPVKSAGFVRIWTDPGSDKVCVSCFGEGRSLGIPAHPDSDEYILETFLNKE